MPKKADSSDLGQGEQEVQISLICEECQQNLKFDLCECRDFQKFGLKTKAHQIPKELPLQFGHQVKAR